MRNYFIYSIELFLIFKFANSLSTATDSTLTTDDLTNIPSTLATTSNLTTTVTGSSQNSTNITTSMSSISATTTFTNTSTNTTTFTSTFTTTPSKCRYINCQNNGTCLLDNSSDPYCSCQNSFSGKYCEIYIGSCSKYPCQNDGICTPEPNGPGYNCSCLTNYFGKNCDIFNICGDNRCENNSTCQSSLNNTYTCKCDENHYGIYCEYEKTSCNPNNPCLNDGLCTVNPVNGSYSCLCLDGYTGRNCETSTNPCNSNPCNDNGVCVAFNISKYLCDCFEGKYGINCEYSVTTSITTTKRADCSISPCTNGGTCVNSKDGYICKCQKYFGGQNCELQSPLLCFLGDLSPYCQIWKAFGYCRFDSIIHSQTVPIYCPKSCGFCK